MPEMPFGLSPATQARPGRAATTRGFGPHRCSTSVSFGLHRAFVFFPLFLRLIFLLHRCTFAAATEGSALRALGCGPAFLAGGAPPAGPAHSGRAPCGRRACEVRCNPCPPSGPWAGARATCTWAWTKTWMPFRYQRETTTLAHQLIWQRIAMGGPQWTENEVDALKVLSCETLK